MCVVDAEYATSKIRNRCSFKLQLGNVLCRHCLDAMYFSRIAFVALRRCRLARYGHPYFCDNARSPRSELKSKMTESPFFRRHTTMGLAWSDDTLTPLSTGGTAGLVALATFYASLLTLSYAFNSVSIRL